MPGFNIPIAPDNSGIECDPARIRGSANQYGDYSHTTETARSHRFHFSLDMSTTQSNSISLGRQISGLYVKNITRPTIEIDRITIHNGPDEIFRPGKIHYSPVDVTFYESINVGGDDSVSDNSSLYLLYRFIKSNTYSDVNIANNISYYNSNIKMLTGNGFVAWEYRLFRVWPMKVSSSNLDYSVSDISETTVSLSYDHAALLANTDE